MNLDFVLLALAYLVIVTLLFGLVFVVGIIWRTEKKLDLAYRFTFVALLALLAARVVDLGYFLEVDQRALIQGVLEFGGVLFLLLSILEMRDIIRFLDKEK